ncbi:MAG TPA: asparagine synthase (glutamine-hydrolyzing) [Gemmatimonadaceae bacterium]|nr:asparagine synthase (glutamine-hydrolyzing) [Gemmatimonadaceae bacterium]
MCGIAGFLGDTPAPHEVLESMHCSIRHRGPDDSGTWWDEVGQIGLAHARLSIVDLSTAGHQPMASPSGRFTIAFNGEIYNHMDLRGLLERDGRRPNWRGHSDTETLLAGFDAWGIAETVKKAVGMFAFAVWDKRDRELTLARDRVGEKPLYYGWQRDRLLFGSELKAFKAHPAFEGEINRDAVALLMRYNYIPAPHSIYRGIAKQIPGTLLTFSERVREPRVTPYWDFNAAVGRGVMHPFQGSPDQAVASLEEKLLQAVEGQMMADVPLGAFLSGGVDSSTVVALMQKLSPRPVRTFTIGFEESAYNEAEHAKAVARHLGTDHTELYVTPQQALDVIPKLPSLYSEPFADSSQIPTYLVSQLARRHVTVSLSGDAGDELFAGYTRYTLTNRLWGKVSRVPIPLRRAAARGIAAVPPRRWNRILDPIQAYLPAGLAQSNVGDKVVKGAGVLAARQPAELYHLMVSHWPDPTRMVIGSGDTPTVLSTANRFSSADGFIQSFMAADTLTYLPDDILVKVDRAAMAVSLESRVPLLDHRVIEFAWTLPLDYKLRAGESKWPLRQILYKYVPRQLIERPKMGFGVPIDAWLRGPLREWAEDLLAETRLREEGVFVPEPIREKWEQHLSGSRNWHYLLWDVLMFQAWLANEKASVVC